MRDEIVGVRHAILLNVRAVRIFRVGPPIIAFGEEVVSAASAAVGGGGGNGDRFFMQIFRRFGHDAGAFDFEEIESRFVGGGGEESKLKNGECEFEWSKE